MTTCSTTQTEEPIITGRMLMDFYNLISIAVNYKFLCFCIQNLHNTKILTSVLRTEWGGKQSIPLIDRIWVFDVFVYVASEAVSNCDILCDVLRIILFFDKGDNQIVAAACVVEMTHQQSGVVPTTMNNWSICDVTMHCCGYQSLHTLASNSIIVCAHSTLGLVREVWTCPFCKKIFIGMCLWY